MLEMTHLWKLLTCQNNILWRKAGLKVVTQFAYVYFRNPQGQLHCWMAPPSSQIRISFIRTHIEDILYAWLVPLLTSNQANSKIEPLRDWKPNARKLTDTECLLNQQFSPHRVELYSQSEWVSMWNHIIMANFRQKAFVRNTVSISIGTK